MKLKKYIKEKSGKFFGTGRLIIINTKRKDFKFSNLIKSTPLHDGERFKPELHTVDNTFLENNNPDYWNILDVYIISRFQKDLKIGDLAYDLVYNRIVKVEDLKVDGKFIVVSSIDNQNYLIENGDEPECINHSNISNLRKVIIEPINIPSDVLEDIADGKCSHGDKVLIDIVTEPEGLIPVDSSDVKVKVVLERGKAIIHKEFNEVEKW